MKESQLENGSGDHESSLQQGLPVETSYVRLISDGHHLVIAEQPEAEDIPVLVYEQYKDGTSGSIFWSFKVDKEALAFTSFEQAKKFALQYPIWLKASCFLLFTKMVEGKKEFLVAIFSFDLDGNLSENVRGLNSWLWYEISRYRYVVPANRILGP
ncbi:MAG: hypothetical protein K9M36_03250 [Candidatus Pacebacteria bacterium]|nr:hypothetical protein [Candidatus Paceibacterota bacterium]